MDGYDVVVVGARVAGAATALLLARAGHRVLVLDRARRGTDTLSTHALMRPAVTQLARWGLLDDLVAAGTPGQDRVVFRYGDREVPIDLARRLYAPRRTVLDPLLVAAAERAGARFRFGVHVRSLVRDRAGRVVGVRGRDRRSGETTVSARVTVGADGRRSRVAAAVGAPVTRRGTAVAATVYGYWRDLPTHGFEWCFRPGHAAGLIPTDAGETCVFVTVPARSFARLRRDADAGLHRELAATSPSVASRVADAGRHGPLRGFPGMAGWLRRPWGPGWALVGDAGAFRDPSTAHGISDALRDAELLAGALDQALGGTASARSALAAYERRRDDLAIPVFDTTDAVAGFGWDLAEVQRLHVALSTDMDHEVDALEALAPPWVHAAA